MSTRQTVVIVDDPDVPEQQSDPYKPPGPAPVFEDSDDETEQQVSKPWVLISVALAVAILCVVTVLTLIYIGHLQPLTQTEGDNTLKSVSRHVAGVTDHPTSKMGNSVSKLLGSPSPSTPSVSASAASSLSNQAFIAGMKKQFSASDAVAQYAEEDQLDDAPGLAAFMGLKFIHHHDHNAHSGAPPS